jgi:molybdenum cofactor synthesis domain-containing protein
MSGIRVGVVVVSDTASSGERPDGCAGALAAVLPAGASLAERLIVPDEIAAIRGAVAAMADGGRVDVVLTAGGTGLSPRDVTPEALAPLMEKNLPGMGELIRMKGFESKPTAILSRAVAGTRGAVVIIALPGSPRGAAESLALVWPAIPHALETLRGEARECAGRTD